MNNTSLSNNAISNKGHLIINYGIISNFTILSNYCIFSYITSGSNLGCFRYHSFRRDPNHLFLLFKYFVGYPYKNISWVIKEDKLSSTSWFYKSAQTFFTQNYTSTRL